MADDALSRAHRRLAKQRDTTPSKASPLESVAGLIENTEWVGLAARRSGCGSHGHESAAQHRQLFFNRHKMTSV